MEAGANCNAVAALALAVARKVVPQLFHAIERRTHGARPGGELFRAEMRKETQCHFGQDKKHHDIKQRRRDLDRRAEFFPFGANNGGLRAV